MLINKVCSKCKIEKSVTEFSKRSNRSCGLQSKCKACDKKYNQINKELRQKYYNKNKKRIKERQKYYYQNNKAYINKRNKLWAQANKDRLKQTSKAYYKIKKNIIKQKQKNWYEANKQHVQNYIKIRQQTDPMFKLSRNLRYMMNNIFNHKRKYGKKTRTHQLLGADYETVFAHLQETARINYGFWLAELDYHIDHIVPCSTAKTEEELIALQHYKNLQLLRPCDNLAKGDRLDYITPYMRQNKEGEGKNE